MVNTLPPVSPVRAEERRATSILMPTCARRARNWINWTSSWASTRIGKPSLTIEVRWIDDDNLEALLQTEIDLPAYVENNAVKVEIEIRHQDTSPDQERRTVTFPMRLPLTSKGRSNSNHDQRKNDPLFACFASLSFYYLRSGRRRLPPRRNNWRKPPPTSWWARCRPIYSYKEREGIPVLSGYEYDHKVAEVKIEKDRERQDCRKPDLRPLLEPQVERVGASAPGWTILRKSAQEGSDLPFLPSEKCLRRLVEGIEGWRIQCRLRQRNPTDQEIRSEHEEKPFEPPYPSLFEHTFVGRRKTKRRLHPRRRPWLWGHQGLRRRRSPWSPPPTSIVSARMA